MNSYWVHNLDPVLLHLGPLNIRWYGVMYVLGLFIAVWWLGKRQEKGLFVLPKKENIQDMAFYGFLGILIAMKSPKTYIKPYQRKSPKNFTPGKISG